MILILMIGIILMSICAYGFIGLHDKCMKCNTTFIPLSNEPGSGELILNTKQQQLLYKELTEPNNLTDEEKEQIKKMWKEIIKK